MKQSSIEWAVSSLDKLIPSGNDLVIGAILLQAKAMHKEEIMGAHGEEQNYLEDDGSWRMQTGEEYYNETFNTKEK
jgi:hypothetical protein